MALGGAPRWRRTAGAVADGPALAPGVAGPDGRAVAMGPAMPRPPPTSAVGLAEPHRAERQRERRPDRDRGRAGQAAQPAADRPAAHPSGLTRSVQSRAQSAGRQVPAPRHSRTRAARGLGSSIGSTDEPSRRVPSVRSPGSARGRIGRLGHRSTSGRVSAVRRGWRRAGVGGGGDEGRRRRGGRGGRRRRGARDRRRAAGAASSGRARGWNRRCRGLVRRNPAISA